MLLTTRMRKILAFIFIVNAVFWGLFPHATHCNALKQVGLTQCPPHYVHIMMGITCYFVSLFLSQQKYLMK